jgi:hypothetical protein
LRIRPAARISIEDCSCDQGWLDVRRVVLRFSTTVGALTCALVLAGSAFAADDDLGPPSHVPPPPGAAAAPPAGPAAPNAPPDKPDKPAAEKNDADRAIKLSNFFGLSGMRDMIDGRIPSGITIRGGFTWQNEEENLKGTFEDFSSNRISLQAYGGVAALDLFEVGGRLPFEIDHTTKGYTLTGGHTRESGSSVGNLDLAGKIAIPVGPLTLAPYAIATFPSGDPRFDKSTGFAVGGATTIAVFGSRLAIHANVDGAWRSGGQVAIDYRIGASIVPLATSVILVRPFLYLDGAQELDHAPGSNIRIAAGAQALLFDFLTFELGGDYRLLGTANPDSLSKDLGSWTVDLGAGVVF